MQSVKSGLVLCSIAGALMLSACASKDGNQTSGTAGGGTASSGDAAVITAMQVRIKELEAKNAELQQKIDTLASGTASPAIATTGSPSASSTPSSSANASNASASSTATGTDPGGTSQSASASTYTDIGDYANSADIAEMERLHVLEPIAGKFEPQKPATRREFVKWLVKSANILLTKANQSDKCIRMARVSKPGFTDLKATDPDLPLIEGLLNAGIAVGYEDHTFKPEQPITRAEMLSIKGALDDIVSYGKANVEMATGDWFYTGTYSDYQLVPRSLAGGMRLAFNSGEIARIYGTLRMIKPSEKVTRAEAALCVSSLGARHDMSIAKMN